MCLIVVYGVEYGVDNFSVKFVLLVVLCGVDDCVGECV